MTLDAAFSTKTAEPGNWGGLSFCSEIHVRYLAAHVECCKTFKFVYLAGIVSLFVNVPKSNGTIVVLTKKTCYFRLKALSSLKYSRGDY